MSQRPGAARLSPSALGGFTLLEVVVALLVLEVAVLGAVGILVIAGETLFRAERLERVAARAEGIVDSLAAAPAPTTGSLVDSSAVIDWAVGAAGSVLLTASSPTGDTLLELRTVLPPRPGGP